MKRQLSATVFVLIVLCCSSVFAQSGAGVMKFEAEGNAVIGPNGVTEARDAAFKAALQKAVLDAIAFLAPLSVKDEKIPEIKTAIVENQDKYINNFKIVTENRQPENYFITVSVDVEISGLKKDLAQMGFSTISTGATDDIIVFLNIKGFEKYSDFLSLKDFLRKRLKSVKNVYPRSFEWHKAGLEITISGTVQVLADELAGAGLYKIDTEQIDSNQLTVSLLHGEGR